MTKILAHRGASAYAPENTMEAFSLAIQMGADGIETDVHLSKDGVLMVCHDFNTQRVSGQSVMIADSTYQELQKINVGAYFDDYGVCKMPTLAQLLQLLAPTNRTLNIEIKSGQVIYAGIEEKLVSLVREFGMEERVLYSSFNHYSLRILKALNPRAKIGLLYQTALFEPWRYACYVGADAIHPYFITLQAPGVVSDCHNHGVMVNPWTVDDPKHMAWLYKMGVDALITNKPDVALLVREGMEEEQV